jgi:hypothetical protein
MSNAKASQLPLELSLEKASDCQLRDGHDCEAFVTQMQFRPWKKW